MLESVVLLPHAFEVPNGADQAQQAIRVSLLKQLESDCVVLIPSASSVTGLVNLVSNWQPKYQQPGLALLKALKRHNRFVELPPMANETATCPAGSCTEELRVARFRNPDHTLIGDRCIECCIQEGIGGALDLNDYTTSDFCLRSNERQTYTLNDGSWTKSQFEQRALGPLFRYAKHIKIIDRYLARSLDVGNGRLRHQIKREFSLGLESFFANFVTRSSRSGRTFEVYTGFNRPNGTTWTSAEKARVKSMFSTLAAQLTATYGQVIRIFVKDESREEMDHNRYVITDQIAVSIDRGLDPFWSDARMRQEGLNPVRDERRVKDIFIAKCDAGLPEVRARLLPDL